MTPYAKILPDGASWVEESQQATNALIFRDTHRRSSRNDGAAAAETRR